jgi:hypothetical protein
VTSGVDLKAEVRFTGRELRITNRGQQAWEDVALSIDGALDAGGYAAHFDRVAAGRTISLPSSRFVDSAGRAFQGTRPPQSLTIAAHIVGAATQGVYEARWP